MWSCWLQQSVTSSSLDQFTAMCKARMTISTSKFEAMVLSQKRWIASFRLGRRSYPKWSSSGWRKNGAEGRQVVWCSVCSNADCALIFCSEARDELKVRALKVLVDLCYPNLTYCHQLWIRTDRRVSLVQVAEVSFCRTVAGLSLKDRARSSVIREELE